MSDLISRQAAIERIDAIFPVHPEVSEYARGIACGAALAKIHVNQLPSAEPEIIRCKDCKYSDTFADVSACDFPLKCLGIRYCGVFNDWYCEHGERREADDE